MKIKEIKFSITIHLDIFGYPVEAANLFIFFNIARNIS